MAKSYFEKFKKIVVRFKEFTENRDNNIQLVIHYIRENGLDKKPISTLVGIIGLLYIILFDMSLSSELGWGFPLFIGLLVVVLSCVIISINRIIERYIREMELDKKSVSKFVIIIGLICIIPGIVLANFSHRAVGSFLAFIGFLIVLYGLGLNPD